MYSFPIDLFKPGTLQPWLANTRVSGGNTLNGVGQEADWSGGGYWCLEMTGFSVSTADQHLKWLGMCTRLADGYTDVEMTFLDGYTWPVGNATPDTMSFIANADTNLSATSIDIKVLAGGELREGHRFTVDHEIAGARIYSIFDATNLGGNVYRCKFRPPFREAVLLNSPLDFKTLRLVMTVKSTAKDIWPKVQPPYKANPQMLLIESFSYQNGLV